jgi:cation diffusion facilitator CzcD-associated flavoprotein CzcO
MDASFGVKPGNHIPGMVLHEYLCKYADKFDLTRRIRQNSRVLSAEKVDDGRWKLQIKVNSGSGRDYNIICHKLIVATGLTSAPVSVGSISRTSSYSHFTGTGRL